MVFKAMRLEVSVDRDKWFKDYFLSYSNIGFPLPIPGNLPKWGFKPASPVSPALQEPSSKPGLVE